MNHSRSVHLVSLFIYLTVNNINELYGTRVADNGSRNHWFQS